MTKENQKRLYLHFRKTEKEYSGAKAQIIKANMKRYAEDILKSYPEFEVKEKPVTKPKSQEQK